MPASNAARLYHSSYKQAVEKYVNKDKRAEALEELKAILYDAYLPRLYGLMANLQMAEGVDDWFQAELCIKDAEEMFTEVEQQPDFNDEAAAAKLRQDLEICAEL